MTGTTRQDLIDLVPRHDTLVAIDSDGCVFDSMGVKQIECFHPEIIRLWGLEPIEPALRAVAEYVNLQSPFRGSNRFVALLKTFEMLPGHPDARRAGVPLPATGALRRFVESGRPLTNDTLREQAARDPELVRILDWSLTVNRVVEETVTDLPPFDGVVSALERLADGSDLIICSQTPEEALVREWQRHDIDRWVRVIAGQELGTKAEHLSLVMQGRYGPDRVLMVGDAPGDLAAARTAGALFFPIVPGDEIASWRLLAGEGAEWFLSGTYAGGREVQQIARFEAALPPAPPW